jgi:hypothetical protein
MLHSWCGPMPIIIGIGRIKSDAGHTSPVKRRHAMSTTRDTLSSIRRHAIAVLILIFALIWSPIGAFISTEADETRGTTIKSTADQQAHISAELDVFSGRPNPTWNLADAQVRELLGMLRTAQTSRGERPSGAEGLGYRGLILNIVSDSHVEICRVSNGLIEIDGRFLSDAGRRIEAFVIRTLPDDMQKQFAPILSGLLP